MHSVLSPSEGCIINLMRANARMSLYRNSQFFRYSEEAMAETTAQLSTRQMNGFSFSEVFMNGLRFQLVNNHGLTVPRIGLEAAGGTAVVGGGA
jgi:hypothetical protein